MRRLQTGGYVQFNPLPVEVPIYNSQGMQVDPAMYAPIPDQKRPQIEAPDYSEMFKNVDGYTNEKREVVGKAYGAYQRLKDYLAENQYNYNTDYAKRLMKEMTIDPVKKEELINNWKLGREAEKSIGKNESETQWIRNGKGQVMISNGTDYKWMSDEDALMVSATTGLKPMTVGQSVIERNDAEALKFDNEIHTGMRETVGLPVLHKYIESLKADGKVDIKWNHEKLDLDMGQLTIAEKQVAIAGTRGYGGQNSDNIEKYKLAVHSAYEQVRSNKGLNDAIRSTVLNNLLSNKMNITPEALIAEGVIKDVSEMSTVYSDKSKLNKLIEMESKLIVANQLYRHVFNVSDRRTTVSPMQWITDAGAGVGEYKKSKDDFWGAVNTNHNLIEWKPQSVPIPGSPNESVNAKITQIPGTAMEGASKFNGSTVSSLQNASVIFQGHRINDEMKEAGLGNKNVMVVSQQANGDGELIYHYDYKNVDFQDLEKTEKEIAHAITKARDPQEIASLREVNAEIEKAKQYYRKIYVRAKMYVDPSDIEDLKAFKKGDVKAINGFSVTGKSVDPTYNKTVSLIDKDKVPDIVKEKVASSGWFSGKVAVVDVEIEKTNSWFEDPAGVRQEYTAPNIQQLRYKAQTVAKAIQLRQAQTPKP